MKLIERLSSPVVIAQIITTLVGVIIFFAPNQTEPVQVVAGAIIAIVNLFAGINNPTDKKHF